MSNFTQPEPINHNELKRLLQECFEEVIAATAGNGYMGRFALARITSKIDNAILDGDDS